MIGLRFWLAATFLIVLAAVGIYMARGTVLPAVARWLDVGHPPRRADFVMVLDGDRKYRPQSAAAIVKAGLVRQVLVALPIGDDGTGGRQAVASGSMSAALVRCGVPERAIATLPRKVANTHDEALALAGFLQSRPGASATVVTSGYHTRRAKWVFQQVLGPERDSVSFVSAPADWLDPDNWWQTESGRQTVSLEYGKLAFYLLRYGPWPYYAATAVALFAGVLFRRQFAGNPVIGTSAKSAGGSKRHEGGP